MSKGGSGAEAAAAANTKIDLGIDELRNQFAQSQQAFQPFIDVGLQGLQGQAQGSTVQGLGDILGQIFNGGALQPLIDERTRAAQGQLAAGGLTRSGTALETISAIPQDIGLAIEQMLAGRQGQLAQGGFTGVQNVAQLGAGTAQGIAGSRTQQGENLSSGILADAQAKAAGISNAIKIASTAAMAFSDPRLKTNVMKVSEIGNLDVFEWDWIPETKGTAVESQPTLGFMATQIEEKYPEFVGVIDGFKAVMYGPLLDKLQEKYGNVQCQH